MRKERGMLDRKELWISCRAMWLRCKKDARKFATTEDLGEKGIFRDASGKQLVGGRDDDRIISAGLNVFERRQDTSSLPGAGSLTRLSAAGGACGFVV